jgi:hypothetical protein
VKFVWLSFIAAFFIGTFINGFFGYDPAVPVFLFAFHAAFLLAYIALSPYFTGAERLFVFAGCVLRIAGLLYDIYADEPFLMLNISTDAEAFYESGHEYYGDWTLLFRQEDISPVARRGGAWGRFVGVWFLSKGPSRLSIQYLSTLCGISIILMVKKIMVLIGITLRTQLTVIIIISVNFNFIMKSSTLQREMHPAFLVACSLYFFILWLKHGGAGKIAATVIFLLGASFFHAGAVGIAAGYVLAFVFYRREKNAYVFTSKSIAYTAAALLSVFIVYTLLGDTFFVKFTRVEDIDDLYDRASRAGRGGAAYNVPVSVNNPIGLVFGGTLRAVYFLSAPLPWYWRNFMDIATFLLDAYIYIIIVSYTIINKNKIFNKSTRSKWIIALTVSVFICSFIFGLGVSNAGPAMRHRGKILPVFMVLFALEIDEVKRVKGLKD